MDPYLNDLPRPTGINLCDKIQNKMRNYTNQYVTQVANSSNSAKKQFMIDSIRSDYSWLQATYQVHQQTESV